MKDKGAFDSLGARQLNSRSNENSSRAVIIRNFLGKEELSTLTEYVLKQELNFKESTILPAGKSEGSLDHTYRKSSVLYELAEFKLLISERVLQILPAVITTLKREVFPIAKIDLQITASNHGDFFKIHRDNGAKEPWDVSQREISFVYYFHSKPKAFTGGELRIYDSPAKQYFETILPRHNSIVFFTSDSEHEVMPVFCTSRKFFHSRFTINGWIIKPPA